jgi:hypothetical protein
MKLRKGHRGSIRVAAMFLAVLAVAFRASFETL